MCCPLTRFNQLNSNSKLGGRVSTLTDRDLYCQVGAWSSEKYLCSCVKNRVTKEVKTENEKKRKKGHRKPIIIIKFVLYWIRVLKNICNRIELKWHIMIGSHNKNGQGVELGLSAFLQEQWHRLGIEIELSWNYREATTKMSYWA